ARNEQPALPALLHGIVQLQAPPVVPARSLTAQASTESLPTCGRQLSQNRRDLPLRVVEPDRLVGRDRQHIGLLAPLQPRAQSAIVAIHTITGYEGQRQARIERAREHLPRQFRFGRKGALIGNAGSTTALAILRPFFWQIQLAIQQRL